MSDPKMTFHVETVRLGPPGSLSRCKQAEIPPDTDLAGNPKAFNPAELLLAALSACIIKGIERVIPILQFDLRGVNGVTDLFPLFGYAKSGLVRQRQERGQHIAGAHGLK